MTVARHELPDVASVTVSEALIMSFIPRRGAQHADVDADVSAKDRAGCARTILNRNFFLRRFSANFVMVKAPMQNLEI